MLKQLYIRNFALIDELDIPFHDGFSVITGETGAGKSIILGAIGLLLGNRADPKWIKKEGERCVIEAHFDISRYGMDGFFQTNDIDLDETDTILRREMNSNGKSRAFINDTPVSLATMRELGDRLVDIHSQHQNLLLQKENFQLGVVDVMATNDKQLAAYKKAYAAYRDSVRNLEQLKETLEKGKSNEDFLRFQYQELLDAQLQDGEQEQLEQESETMGHAEEIKTALYEACHSLNADQHGVLSQLKATVGRLQDIQSVYPATTEWMDRMESCLIDLKDMAQDMTSRTEDITFDPVLLEQIHGKLDRIYALQQKHHVGSVKELLALQEQWAKELSAIDNSDVELAECERQVERNRQLCAEQAAVLTTSRTKAAKKIEKEMLALLSPLGIPHVRFEVQLTPKELGPDGSDKVAFLFSANSSTPLQPVAQVASGGEIARVMLSLKALISGTVKLPTIIFDEIDTGVSGRVAEKMAEIMRDMGQQGRQVISITHLPQIAALGTTHYRVSKEETSHGTESRMEVLTPEDRVAELAQMLSGTDISTAAIENAKTLLNKNHQV